MCSTVRVHTFWRLHAKGEGGGPLSVPPSPSPHPHHTSLTLVNRKKGGLRTPQLYVNFSLLPMSAMKLWVMESQPFSPGLVLLSKGVNVAGEKTLTKSLKSGNNSLHHITDYTKDCDIPASNMASQNEAISVLWLFLHGDRQMLDFCTHVFAMIRQI